MKNDVAQVVLLILDRGLFIIIVIDGCLLLGHATQAFAAVENSCEVAILDEIFESTAHRASLSEGLGHQLLFVPDVLRLALSLPTRRTRGRCSWCVTKIIDLKLFLSNPPHDVADL